MDANGNSDELELLILISLVNATIEQQSSLIGKFRGGTEIIFREWFDMSSDLSNSIQKDLIPNENLLNSITDVIHDSVSSLRKELKR